MNPASIKLLILDVDGVLTDGRLVIGPDGGEAKAFFAQDGYAIKLWQRHGGQVAILSGKGGEAVTRRARDLDITIVHTRVANKLEAYVEILASAKCADDEAAYLGDDLPDLAPMRRVGFPIAVANARPIVKQTSRYVTRREGGHGAVAEVVELLLRKQGKWSREAIEES